MAVTMHDDHHRLVVPPNPHIAEIPVDFLYHLGLDTSMDLQGMFGDVKYVCMGGSAQRMRAFANRAKSFLGLDRALPPGCELAPIGKPERYELYKIGPIISVSHGMGMPSMKILLHEIAKLLSYAKAKDVVFLRIGTCGGIGVQPGTVVLTTEALSPKLQPYHKIVVLGKTLKVPTTLSAELNQELMKHKGDLRVEAARTVSTNDFYEEQGRIDGFFCEHDEKEKSQFLERCKEQGVLNFEMESGAFASFCYRGNIPGAVICSVLLDRTKGDQVTSTHEEMVRFTDSAVTLVLNYIKARLDANKGPLD